VVFIGQCLKCGAGVKYRDMKGMESVVAGIYLWPNTKKDDILRMLDQLKRWDILVGDFNSRHQDWEGMDGRTSQMGRVLKK
jgi:hypothetical protein